MARVKIVKIHRDILLGLLRMDGTKRYRIDGLPDDARIVGMSGSLYFDSDNLAVKVESDTFADIGYCDHIPPLSLEISEIHETAIRREFL